jgi:hypothetical protein
MIARDAGNLPGKRRMSGWQIAQMNVGRIVAAIDHPQLADFVAQLDEVNALAEASPGFVWRLQSESGNATDIKPTADPQFIVNMSVWESVEALFDYAYKSAHRLVMARRREWFERPETGYQVLWWVPAGHRPTVEEGLARLAKLNAEGPTPEAFNFKARFPTPGKVGGPEDMRPEPYCVGWE